MARSATTNPRSAALAAAKPAPFATWVYDGANQALMAGLLWLLFVRVVIPGFFDYGVDDLQAINDGVAVNQVIWLALLLIPFALLRSRLRLTWVFIRSLNGFFVALILLAGVSTIWSIDAGATERRVFHLLALYLVCAAACLVGWHSRRFQNVLRPILTILLTGSIIFGLIRPDLAISAPNFALGETAYYWRGLAGQKNGFGGLAGFGVIFWFHAWISKEAKFVAAVCGIAVSATCLRLSGSSTSLLATLIAVLFLLTMQFMPRRLRRYQPYAIALLFGVMACYTLAVLKIVPGLDAVISSVTSSVGKDTTFTGRTPIWALIKEHIQSSPLLGTGYGAYWTAPVASSPSYVFLKRLFFYPWESHNGYLEIVNDLGFVGLVILVGSVVNYLVLAVRLLKIDRSQALLYMALLFYELLTNMTESIWLSVGPDWLIITFATYAMSRAILDRRLHGVFGSPLSPGNAAQSIATNYRPARRTRTTATSRSH